MTLTRTEAVLLDALRGGRRVPTISLIVAVWPDRRRYPTDPYGAIRVHAHNLRRKLPRYLRLIGKFREGYQLVLSRAPAGMPEVVKSAAYTETSETFETFPAVSLHAAGAFSSIEDFATRATMRSMTAPIGCTAEVSL